MSQSGRPKPNYARLQRLALRLLVVAGLIALAADFFFESIHLPGSIIFLARPTGTIVAIVLFLFAWSLRYAPAQAAIFMCLFVYASLIAISLGNRKPGMGDITIAPSSVATSATNSNEVTTPIVHVSDYEWFHQHTRPDPIWGHGGIPRVVARHQHREFDVHYSFDDDGWRLMPDPKISPPLGEIFILGCSFTVGMGVDDEETYSYLLASGPWNTCRVRNFSHIAWGTSHAYLFLKHQLDQGRQPSCVIYAWISRHAARNYKRKSWHQGTGLNFPLFDLENGKLVYKGIVPQTEANWPNGPELDAKEVEVSLALIHAMNELCKTKNVLFVVMAIADGEAKPDLVLPRLRNEPGIHILDFTEVTNDLHPINRHPTKYYQRDIARTLASDHRLSEWTGVSELYQPGSILPSPLAWQLTAMQSTGGWGKIERPDRPESPFRLTELHLGSAKQWDISIRSEHLPLQANKSYSLRMRMRADQPRETYFNISQDHEPWTVIGPSETLKLTPQWQDFEFSFTSPIDDSHTCLVFPIGDSDIPFELQAISLTEGEKDIIREMPLPVVPATDKP